jgi:hypothetical protein
MHPIKELVFLDERRIANVSSFNPLRPSGKHMNHLLSQSVMLHFVFVGFACFSL